MGELQRRTVKHDTLHTYHITKDKGHFFLVLISDFEPFHDSYNQLRLAQIFDNAFPAIYVIKLQLGNQHGFAESRHFAPSCAALVPGSSEWHWGQP